MTCGRPCQFFQQAGAHVALVARGGRAGRDGHAGLVKFFVENVHDSSRAELNCSRERTQERQRCCESLACWRPETLIRFGFRSEAATATPRMHADDDERESGGDGKNIRRSIFAPMKIRTQASPKWR